MNGFVIPDLNVSSIVSDTDTRFSICYWGKDEAKAMESDFNCKSIYLRKIDQLIWSLPISRVKQISEEKPFFFFFRYLYQDRALSWDSRGSSVKPASWFRQENLESRQF